MRSPQAINAVDAQLHLALPREPVRLGTAEPRLSSVAVSAEEMIRAMRAVSVVGGVVAADTLVPTASDYAHEASVRHPGVFRFLAAPDPEAGDLDERVARLRADPTVVGLRVALLTPRQIELWWTRKYEPLLRAAERHALPVTLYPPTLLGEIPRALARHENVQFVIDHLGLPQPTSVSDRDPEPFQRLPELLALAHHPNVAVKLTGAPTLSRESYPFADLWPHLHRVIAAFGPSRVLWGSDWTRMVGRCNYAEATDFIRETDELSKDEKAKIMGGTLERIFKCALPGVS